MTTTVGRLELFVLCVFAASGGLAGAAMHIDAHEWFRGGTDLLFAAVFDIIALVQAVKIFLWLIRRGWR